MPSVSFFLLPPTLYAKHNAIWYRVSLGSVGISCPSCVPSGLFVQPQPLAGGVGWKAEKALILCKCCSSVMKTSLYCQHFPAQIQNTATQKLLSQPNPSHLSTASAQERVYFSLYWFLMCNCEPILMENTCAAKWFLCLLNSCTRQRIVTVGWGLVFGRRSCLPGLLSL